MIIHDPRSNENNVEAVQGAPHIHFHYRTSDMSAVDRGGKKGSPLCCEMVCHGCHASAIVFYRVDTSGPEPRTARGQEVMDARDGFCREHRSCRGEPRVDYERACDARRNGRPKVFDFAGALE